VNGGMSLTNEELERFVASLAAAPERWQHLVQHCSDARVYEQIWDDEDVNAWVIAGPRIRTRDFTTTTSRRRPSR
jgi:hypothetical protein